jgi:hypothetical protein
VCTQFWKNQYKPRNYVPWAITLASYVGDWILILAIRVYLQRENARRDRAAAAAGIEGAAAESEKDRARREEFGYVERKDAEGHIVRLKVEKALLDLTVSPLPSSPCLNFFGYHTIDARFVLCIGSREPSVPIRAVKRSKGAMKLALSASQRRCCHHRHDHHRSSARSFHEISLLCNC